MKTKNVYKKHKNNATKKVLNEILETIGAETTKVRRAQFKHLRRTISFSISPTVERASCRQFYKSSNGLLAYIVSENKFFYFPKKELQLSKKPHYFDVHKEPVYGATVIDIDAHDKKISNYFNKKLKFLI